MIRPGAQERMDRDSAATTEIHSDRYDSPLWILVSCQTTKHWDSGCSIGGFDGLLSRCVVWMKTKINVRILVAVENICYGPKMFLRDIKP